MNYDTSLIDAELRRNRSKQRQDEFIAIVQTLYPLACLLFAILFLALFSSATAYCILMWFSEPAI